MATKKNTDTTAAKAAKASKPKSAKTAKQAESQTGTGSTSIKVLSIEGKEVGTIDLNPEVFGVTPNETLVHDTVRWQLARRRSGTHQALTRSMKKGGKKKPFKQKGTGRARAGSSISPLWVGGASVHGPLPRDYDYRLPKRTRRQALASVLSDKVLNSKVIVIDELTLKEGKTKTMAAALQKIGVVSQSATIIVEGSKGSEAVVRGSRNLPKILTLTATAANVYDILRHEFVVLSKDGVKAIEERVLNA